MCLVKMMDIKIVTVKLNSFVDAGGMNEYLINNCGKVKAPIAVNIVAIKLPRCMFLLKR